MCVDGDLKNNMQYSYICIHILVCSNSNCVCTIIIIFVFHDVPHLSVPDEQVDKILTTFLEREMPIFKNTKLTKKQHKNKNHKRNKIDKFTLDFWSMVYGIFIYRRSQSHINTN